MAGSWLRGKGRELSALGKPWFMAVNFVNPHDIMSYDYGGRGVVKPPPNLAEALVVKPPADIPVYQKQWDVDLPASLGDDLSGAAPAVREYAAPLKEAGYYIPYRALISTRAGELSVVLNELQQ